MQEARVPPLSWEDTPGEGHGNALLALENGIGVFWPGEFHGLGSLAGDLATNTFTFSQHSCSAALSLYFSVYAFHSFPIRKHSIYSKTQKFSNIQLCSSNILS